MEASKELEQQREAGVARVDPRDEPSAEWGWHGSFPKGRQIAGWLVAFIFLGMLYGPHESNIENYVLVVISVSMMAGLVWDLRRQRRSWRR